MSFSGWMIELWYVHTMGYIIQGLKEWAAKPWKKWLNLQCMLLSDSIQSEKVHTVWFYLYDILKKVQP